MCASQILVKWQLAAPGQGVKLRAELLGTTEARDGTGQSLGDHTAEA